MTFNNTDLLCSSSFIEENKDYLKDSLITYLGNKRKILPFIKYFIDLVKGDLKLAFLKSADLFSGSGVVARLLKENSYFLLVNDLEIYSYVLNRCYLASYDVSGFQWLEKEIEFINRNILHKNFLKEGILSQFYSSEKDEFSLSASDRVFYTRRNALFIDSVRNYINRYQGSLEKYAYFILAPLLVQASIHVNTGGVFKSFYKKNGIGNFGGKNSDALLRIKAPIQLHLPLLSKNQNCELAFYCEDINSIIDFLNFKYGIFDLVYLDPPYNEHPYGSNYFMLNLIVKNSIDTDISLKSGIPKDWKRSSYYSKSRQKEALEDLIANIKARYILLSYSEGGFISYSEIVTLLKVYGKYEILHIDYPIYRASRNTKKKDQSLLKEYLFLLKKA